MQVLTKRLPKQLGLVDAKTVCPELRRPRVGRLNSKTQHCHTPQGTSSYRDVDCGGNTRSRPWRSTRTRPRSPAYAPGQLDWQPYGCERAAACGVPIEQVINAR